MTDRNRAARNSTQPVRTAADVLAEGWQEGDDFEISFTMTAPAPQQGSGQTQQTRRR